MKRFVMLLLVCLLLSGCAGKEPPATTVPTAAPTEQSIPWMDLVGMPWNEDGSLRELPLNIPDALHYNNASEYDGDLLLWSIDNHLADVSSLEMCLIELDTGVVAAQREIEFTGMASPQILGSRIFLCDQTDGTILELNKYLETVNSWKTEPRDAGFTMGQGGMLYIFDWNGSVYRHDLNTGQEVSLFPEDCYIDYFNPRGDYASIDYFSGDSATQGTVLLDLKTGDLLYPPMERKFNNLYYCNGTWLGDTYRDSYTAYVCAEGGEVLRAELGYDDVRLLPDGRILRTWEDGCTISLHDPSGAPIARTNITSMPFSYTPMFLIPSEAFGGYFIMLTDHASSMRLLYWNTFASAGGEAIPFAPIPEPGEMEAAIRQRVKKIQEQYGLTILVGEDTDTLFYDFSAEQVTDWDLVDSALDTLENALQDYPEGFFRQLRYDTIRGVDIHLVGNLTSTTAEYVHTYDAFVQYEYDRFTMGVDIYRAGEQTYYHEFSHVIDSFLEWDASVREDALFSEADWCELNPGWFPGYSYDYSQELFLVDDISFVDSYSTIKPTEDRARVMEYAMVDYGVWTFEGRAVLQAKLAYYCRCIRDAFDTSGWPETVLWEQYL